ncbi:MAG: PASTA domain-containing protein, partial [Clostridia bacterium]|nr:PASTA domain-containing protein [Clostridia bacterium]
IANETIRKELDELPEEEQDQAYAEAQERQWRNKGVSDTYVPGSVYKMVTASAVLSEGLVKEDTRFSCSGAYSPYEGASPISCWNTAGHGVQTISEALCNSCNPAFMQMGFMLGREKFYEYYVAFGMSERTGIDLPGESDDYFFNNGGVHGMQLMDLAVASFGQNFKITPIQMVTACAAIANNGKLMQPYVVSQISDSEGNVVKTTEPTVKRQAVSAEVAKSICSMLEENVISGGATNGYIAGYRIGAKTGTSQKIVDENGNPTDDYIASFCGIAPCDDPEIALLCYFDTPDPEINYYGSAVSGPCFRNILSEVLPYLGIEKVYSDDESGKLDTTTKAYVGIDLEDAKKQIEDDGLNYQVVGEGSSVVAQNPIAYTKIPKDGTVVLYTEDNSSKKMVKVPDFKNCTISEANNLAAEYNLNLSIEGSQGSEGVSYAKSQNIQPGTPVEEYTVITVTFNQDNSIM